MPIVVVSTGKIILCGEAKTIVFRTEFPFPSHSLYSRPLWEDECPPKRKMIAATNRLVLGPLAPHLVPIPCGVKPVGGRASLRNELVPVAG